ncbi:MlaD family protein [Gammaproteobacteria bacterium]|nr:MlaD family protein [Gammaproteobacteria bacterium]
MKQGNEKAIGAFVISSILLLIASVMIFGSSSIFSSKRTFVLYFSDSINGLEKGASVKFKGVKIGQVKQITLQVNIKDKAINLPVIIEIDSANLSEVQGTIENNYKFIDYLIKQGLRAQLKSNSLITGQLYIEMNFDPKSPLVYKKNVTKYKQIPTAESSTEAMTNAFQSAQEVMASVNKLVKSKELSKAITSFRRTMDSINNRVDSKQVSKVLDSADKTFSEAQIVLSNLDPVIRSAQEDLDKLKDALSSFTALTDYLSRHPESIIQGKG